MPLSVQHRKRLRAGNNPGVNTPDQAPSTAPTGGGLTELAERLDGALPQTQCTRCGYPDCAAYAQAMATGQAAINQCPPGPSSP